MPIQWEPLTTWAIKFGISLCGGAAVFAGFWVLSIIVGLVFRRIEEKVASYKKQIFRFLAQIARIGVLTFGVITAIGTMGVNISALVAGLGLTGFALGFALKDAISNLLAGMMIIFYRPFRLDDHIAVAGVEGKVASIDLRYTLLVQDDKTYLVPNSSLFTNTVTIVEERSQKQAA